MERARVVESLKLRVESNAEARRRRWREPMEPHEKVRLPIGIYSRPLAAGRPIHAGASVPCLHERTHRKADPGELDIAWPGVHARPGCAGFGPRRRTIPARPRYNVSPP